MEPQIKRPVPETEFVTDEGCWILESWNEGSDPVVSIARARVEPGVSTQWHRLSGTAERYLMIEGTGTMEVGTAAPAEVKPGDVVLIPPGVPQRITNTGTQDLVFYCICTPSFTPECYHVVE